ncbi:retrovirus-related pol polyprotein from transposon TNT 1-94 [Tanacetum coccineum]
MDSDKYLEGQPMQRPPLFESDSFIYWENRFEMYVKSNDLDLWHVITNSDFQPIIQNPKTKLDEVVPFEKQSDELKRRLAKNNEAKMVIYNALPRKEYERICMCNTEKDNWKALLIAHQGKTPYELLRGRKPTLDYFRVFGTKCFIFNTKDYLAKFDPKSYEDVFLGYSQNSKVYIILNKHTRKIKESLNVTFDETPPPSKTSPLVDDDLDEEEAIRATKKKNLENVVDDDTLEINEIVNIKESRNHPLENVIGNLNQRTLRSQAQNQSNFFCFISTIEPKNVNEA